MSIVGSSAARMIRVTSVARLCALLMCSTLSTANAQAPLSAADLETPAAAAVRKLPKDFVNAPQQRRFSLAAKRDEDDAAKRGIDEIVVTGQRDPEDVLTKRTPMAAFREKLERDRPTTPKEKVQMALCFIGLCAANYGPEGIPVENSAYTRGERGAKKTVLEQSLQFRGTYQ